MYKRQNQGGGDFSKGFNEWFADQFAKRSSKAFINKKPKNIVDKIFNDLVQKVRQFWRKASRSHRNLVRRLGGNANQNPLSTDFETFIENVLTSKREEESVSPDMWVEKKLVKRMNDATKKKMGPELEKTVNALNRLKNRILNGDGIRPVYEIFFSADSYLRRVAGNEIADLFYVRSQQRQSDRKGTEASLLGMVPSLREARDSLNTLFVDTVGDPSDLEVISALAEASDNTVADENLSDLAKNVRKFYRDVYTTYIQPSNSKIGRLENFTPVVLDLEAIAENPDAFIDLILSETKQNNTVKPVSYTHLTLPTKA